MHTVHLHFEISNKLFNLLQCMCILFPGGLNLQFIDIQDKSRLWYFSFFSFFLIRSHIFLKRIEFEIQPMSRSFQNGMNLHCSFQDDFDCYNKINSGVVLALLENLHYLPVTFPLFFP